MHSLSCQSLPALFSRRAGTSAVRSYAGRAVKLELLLIEYQYNLSIVEMGPEPKLCPLTECSIKHLPLILVESCQWPKPSQHNHKSYHTIHAQTGYRHTTTHSDQEHFKPRCLPRPMRVGSLLDFVMSFSHRSYSQVWLCFTPHEQTVPGFARRRILHAFLIFRRHNNEAPRDHVCRSFLLETPFLRRSWQ